MTRVAGRLHRARRGVALLAATSALAALLVASGTQSAVATRSRAPVPAADEISCVATPADPILGVQINAATTLQGVRADLAGRTTTRYDQPALSGAKVVITAARLRPFTAAVGPPEPASALITSSLTIEPPSTHPLCLVSFPGNTRPTALIGLSSGGAHCCLTLRAYDAVGGRWRTTDDALGSGAVRLVPVGSSPAIVTSDGSFAYRFADFAGSGLPVRVLQVQGDRFVDVTRRHPPLIAADAIRWWDAFEAGRSDPLGVLAAWTADECELGNQTRAYSRLRALAAAGSLNLTPGQTDGWATGTAYLADLQSFLVRRGYCAARPA